MKRSFRRKTKRSKRSTRSRKSSLKYKSKKKSTRISFSGIKQKIKSFLSRKKKTPIVTTSIDSDNIRDSEETLSFDQVYLDYPHSTKVYPDHPYIKKHKGLVRHYSYNWGGVILTQTKDIVAVYSSSDIIAPIQGHREDYLMYLADQTPYKSVLYGKTSALIEIGNGNYWRIDFNNGLKSFYSKDDITHFFSDSANGYPCNVFWITSKGDIVIEYNDDYKETNYHDHIILADYEPNTTDPVRIKGIKEFINQIPKMSKKDMSLLLRDIIQTEERVYFY